MKKIARWIGIALAGLLGLIVLATIVIYTITAYRFNQKYDIQPVALPIPSDEDAIARGQHLDDAVLDCTFCHGDDLGGGVVVDEAGLFTVHAPNLTAGEGGLRLKLSDDDWIRAVRHGVGSDGKALLFMSSDIFNHLSAGDLAAIIAFAKSLPPVDNQVPDRAQAIIRARDAGMGD
jgi:hypothetical protein